MIASVFVVPDLTIGLAQERKGRGRGDSDCGSFAGLSAAPLCTVLHYRQRASRIKVININ